MKSKKSKIILGVVISVVTIITIVVLMLTGVITNPFLDTKDLVCTVPYPDSQIKGEIIVKFDKKAKITEYIEKQIAVFPTEEEAKEYYNIIKPLENEQDGFIKEYDDYKVELSGNEITSLITFKIDKSNNRYGKTKKEIKKMYIEEYLYECK